MSTFEVEVDCSQYSKYYVSNLGAGYQKGSIVEYKGVNKYVLGVNYYNSGKVVVTTLDLGGNDKNVSWMCVKLIKM
jgi:hypothetical protein